MITIIITVYATCHWLLAVESVVLYGVQRKLSITHDVVLHMAPETEPYVVMGALRFTAVFYQHPHPNAGCISHQSAVQPHTPAAAYR